MLRLSHAKGVILGDVLQELRAEAARHRRVYGPRGDSIYSDLAVFKRFGHRERQDGYRAL